jgi:hypothetical protein
MNDFWTYAGPLCFGLVVGWVTYRTLRYAKSNGISDIASVIAAVGGAGVTAVIGKENPNFNPFYPYCVGLAIGFFGYVLTAIKLPDVKFLGGVPVLMDATTNSGPDPLGGRPPIK